MPRNSSGKAGPVGRRLNATVSAHAGPEPHDQGGLLNPPVHRASTIIYEDVDAYMGRHNGLYDEVIYGLYGVETTFALGDAIAALENGAATVITPSGTSAIALGLSAFLSTGDHALVVDTVYGPTRRFCDEVLARFGVEVEYFDPLLGEGIARRFRENTRVLYMESPGSLTFEMIDVRAMCAAAAKREIVTMLDNTWATPLFCRPIELGVDVSLISATKYLSGHSDAMIGALTARTQDLYRRLKDWTARWGARAGPDECYLVHRGIRTLDVRMERHQKNAEALIQFLRQRPEVRGVLYPALPDDAGYPLWRRDCTGASGLFGLVLDPVSAEGARQFFNGLKVFSLGSSWGGYESLLVPASPAPTRTQRVAPDGYLVRVHAGLEDVSDLIIDLEHAFQRLARAPAASESRT